MSPGSYFGFANGRTDEFIFFDALGHNPQAPGGGNDRFTFNRMWSNGSHSTDFSYGLAPGHSVEVLYVGAAATYQGSITGTTVAYAEKYRLSFRRSPPRTPARPLTKTWARSPTTSKAWRMATTCGSSVELSFVIKCCLPAVISTTRCTAKSTMTRQCAGSLTHALHRDGYEVSTAADGATALAMLLRNRA